MNNKIPKMLEEMAKGAMGLAELAKEQKIERTLAENFTPGGFNSVIRPIKELKRKHAMELAARLSEFTDDLARNGFMDRRPYVNDVHVPSIPRHSNFHDKVDRLLQSKMRYLYKKGNVLHRADLMSNRSNRVALIRVTPI